jgi:hypothetical protein
MKDHLQKFKNEVQKIYDKEESDELKEKEKFVKGPVREEEIEEKKSVKAKTKVVKKIIRKVVKKKE